MADIKQAAKWMRKGKKVRRSKWPSLRLKMATGREVDSLERGDLTGAVIDADIPRCNDPLDVNDLLADDWKIAE